jgi:hypothetical protein
MGEKVTPKQLKAIEHLIMMGDVSSTAREVQVSRKTVYAWMKQPAFRAALADAQQEALQAVCRQLMTLRRRVVKALGDGLAREESMSNRLRAAELWLSKLPAWLQAADLEARVTELERRVEAGNEATQQVVPPRKR